MISWLLEPRICWKCTWVSCLHLWLEMCLEAGGKSLRFLLLGNQVTLLGKIGRCYSSSSRDILPFFPASIDMEGFFVHSQTMILWCSWTCLGGFKGGWNLNSYKESLHPKPFYGSIDHSDTQELPSPSAGHLQGNEFPSTPEPRSVPNSCLTISFVSSVGTSTTWQANYALSLGEGEAEVWE